MYVKPAAAKQIHVNDEVKEVEKTENKENPENKNSVSGKGCLRGPNWSAEDEKLLVEVINGATYGKNRLVEIAIEQGKFVGRTVQACVEHYEKIWPKILEERKKRLSEIKLEDIKKNGPVDS